MRGGAPASRSSGTDSAWLMFPTAARCFAITPTIAARFSLVALVRAHPLRGLRRLAVGAAGHQRGDRRGVRAALVGVVRQPARHQQRAEVRVAEAELAEALRVPADLGRRIRRVADGDLLREEDDVDGVLEHLDVELAVLAAELHEVERREVAGRVVDVHVLAARVRRVDPARCSATCATS